MTVHSLRAVVAGLCVSAAALAAAAPAHATFPGVNGRIALVGDLLGGSQVLTMDAAGRDLRRVTDLAPDEAAHLPDWSPDGRRLAYCGADGTGEAELYVVEADGTGRHRITSDAGRFDCAPRWSPDGRRIVFARSSPRTGNNTIVTVRADGRGGFTVLTGDEWDAFRPTYTPDGRRIVFESQLGGFVSALWIMNADGTGKRRLTDPAIEAGGPDVSPDGTRVAFFSHENGPLENSLYSIRLDGTGLRRLTGAGAHDVQPSFSPDGRWIVFATTRGWNGSQNVAVIPAAGGAVKLIRTDLGPCPDDDNCVNPDWGPAP
jgi:TolB protein